MTGNKPKSKNEILFEKECSERWIDYRFEAITMEIQPPMTLPIIGKVSAVKYTPDYIIDYKGVKFIVEIKGWSNVRDDKFLLKDYRLFSRYIWDTYQTPLLIVTSAGTKKDGTFGMYLYKDKAFVNKGYKRKTIWEILEENYGLWKD